MKLNEPLKEKKLPFFTWILFEPTAFKVIFIMSMVVGIIISLLLTFLSWHYNWGLEISIIISIVACFNIYTSVKQLKTIKYADNMSINDFVYKGKYKPKKVKIIKQKGHNEH